MDALWTILGVLAALGFVVGATALWLRRRNKRFDEEMRADDFYPPPGVPSLMYEGALYYRVGDNVRDSNGEIVKDTALATMLFIMFEKRERGEPLGSPTDTRTE